MTDMTNEAIAATITAMQETIATITPAEPNDFAKALADADLALQRAFMLAKYGEE